MNSIVRIPIKDYIGLLTLTIVKSNVRSPIEANLHMTDSTGPGKLVRHMQSL